MKRTIAPFVCWAGALTVFAAVSEKIAEHIGTSQRNVLTAVLVGCFALFIALLSTLRRRRRQS
jgi:hypothetical protein